MLKLVFFSEIFFLRITIFQVYRAALAGGVVTDWHLYDTAYTERYLGYPLDDYYEDSSALRWVDNLPNEFVCFSPLYFYRPHRMRSFTIDKCKFEKVIKHFETYVYVSKSTRIRIHRSIIS